MFFVYCSLSFSLSHKQTFFLYNSRRERKKSIRMFSFSFVHIIDRCVKSPFYRIPNNEQKSTPLCSIHMQKCEANLQLNKHMSSIANVPNKNFCIFSHLFFLLSLLLLFLPPFLHQLNDALRPSHELEEREFTHTMDLCKCKNATWIIFTNVNWIRKCVRRVEAFYSYIYMFQHFLTLFPLLAHSWWVLHK